MEIAGKTHRWSRGRIAVYTVIAVLAVAAARKTYVDYQYGVEFRRQLKESAERSDRMREKADRDADERMRRTAEGR